MKTYPMEVLKKAFYAIIDTDKHCKFSVYRHKNKPFVVKARPLGIKSLVVSDNERFVDGFFFLNIHNHINYDRDEFFSFDAETKHRIIDRVYGKYWRRTGTKIIFSDVIYVRPRKGYVSGTIERDIRNIQWIDNPLNSSEFERYCELFQKKLTE